MQKTCVYHRQYAYRMSLKKLKRAACARRKKPPGPSWLAGKKHVFCIAVA
jgi:hypothetical protein